MDLFRSLIPIPHSWRNLVDTMKGKVSVDSEGQGKVESQRKEKEKMRRTRMEGENTFRVRKRGTQHKMLERKRIQVSS